MVVVEKLVRPLYRLLFSSGKSHARAVWLAGVVPFRFIFFSCSRVFSGLLRLHLFDHMGRDFGIIFWRLPSNLDVTFFSRRDANDATKETTMVRRTLR